MTRLLVLGTGPLLEEPGTRQFSGQCLRTLHFVRPLTAEGHHLTLATVPIPASFEEKHGKQSWEWREWGDAHRYRAFQTAREDRLLPALRKLIDKQRPEAIVGINAWPASLLARVAPRLPFWADLNGWTMAEGQTRAAVVGHDRDMDHFWRLEATTLLAADRFSTVSQRQADALYGELAMLGRLTRHTFDWPFACAVPNAVYASYAALERSRRLPPALDSLASDAHIVLWTGGFNTWTDVETLAGALEHAFAAVPGMVFVATGGAVAGHDEVTFQRFRELARERLPRERVHLMGWVDSGLVHELHARADVGISVDGWNTETRFGARNRLTNLMGAGVPVLTTRGTEIAEWIERHGAGDVVAIGDAAALGEALVDSARRREHWQTRADNARKMTLEHFAPEATLPEFLAWAASPGKAPDRENNTDTAFRAPTWARLHVDGRVESLLADSRDLKRLRSRLIMRAWYRLKGLLRR